MYVTMNVMYAYECVALEMVLCPTLIATTAMYATKSYALACVFRRLCRRHGVLVRRGRHSGCTAAATATIASGGAVHSCRSAYQLVLLMLLLRGATAAAAAS